MLSNEAEPPLEVSQRVLDGVTFLREVGGLSKSDAQRIVASWGIDQRAGAVAFLRQIQSSKEDEDAERIIDDWNAKQKPKKAKDFLMKKLRYSEAKAEATVTQWNLEESQGKDAAIRYLVETHRYKHSQAGRTVNRWGNTGNVEKVDPSPVSRSLRLLKEQGLWTQLGNLKQAIKTKLKK